MIVYVYDDDFLNKIFLPTTINGVYPINSFEQKFLCNIEEINGSWVIKKNENVSLFEVETLKDELHIYPYFMGSVVDLLNQKNIIYLQLLYLILIHIMYLQIKVL